MLQFDSEYGYGEGMRGRPHKYQYVNSERDFTLPLQTHKNVQPPYESPEEGKQHRLQSSHEISNWLNVFRIVIAKIYWRECRHGQPNSRKSFESSVPGDEAPMSSAS